VDAGLRYLLKRESFRPRRRVVYHVLVPWAAATGSIAITLICAAALLRFEELELVKLCVPTKVASQVEDEVTGRMHTVRGWWGVPTGEFWRWAAFATAFGLLVLLWRFRRKRGGHILGIVTLVLNGLMLFAAVTIAAVELKTW
jgi:hypothetical protein